MRVQSVHLPLSCWEVNLHNHISRSGGRVEVVAKGPGEGHCDISGKVTLAKLVV